MWMDETLEFADAQTLATGLGKAILDDDVDLGVPAGLSNPATPEGRDIGTGEPLYLVITVDTAVTSGGAATVAFNLVTDAQSPITTDDTESQHATTAPIPVALLVQAAVIVLTVPPEFVVYERFLGVQSEVATAVLTAGAVSAFLTRDRGAVWRAYPDSINVS